MAQFTVSQLARLLKNVDRELLVEALEKADLTSILPAKHLRMIEDREGDWNVLFNLFLNNLTIDQADAVHGAQHSAYAFRRHPAGKPPAGTDALGQFQPTGVLFLDSMVASIQLATEIFNPLGFLAEVHEIVQVLKDFEETQAGRINLYDLRQIALHVIRGEAQIRKAFDWIVAIPDPPEFRDVIKRALEWAHHDFTQIESHKNRFIATQPLGDTFIQSFPGDEAPAEPPRL